MNSKNFVDVTANLSSDPIEREQQLYNRILDFFNHRHEYQQDVTAWEGRTYIKLMKLLDTDDKLLSQSVFNAIILVLVLAREKERSVDTFGIDINELEVSDREKFRMMLLELFQLRLSCNDL